MQRRSDVPRCAPFFALCVSCLGLAVEPTSGVVIEKVGKPSAVENAGIKSGDLLFSWERLPNDYVDGAKGKLDNVFTWLIFLDEQTPRGTIKLFGERDGKKRVFEVSLGDWSGTEVRPVMPLEALSLYLKGKKLVDNGSTAEGVAVWEKAFKDTQIKVGTALHCWVQLQRAKTWAEKNVWEKADAAVDSAMALADEPMSRLAVLYVAARIQQKQGNMDLSSKSYKWRAELWRLSRGEGLGFARTMDLLGTLALWQGNLGIARECYLQTLRIRQNLAPESLVVANSLSGLGLVATDLNDLDAANSYHLEALRIAERLAPGSNTVATILSSLGSVAFVRGDLDKAENNYKRDLAITEKLLPNSLDLAASLNNLGNVAYTRGDLSVAKRFYNQAMIILKKIAPNSLNAADGFNNLGLLAYDRGDLSAATDFHKQALAIRERLAPNSLVVGASLNNLGLLTSDRGDWDTAISYFKRNLAITESLGPGSLAVATNMSNQGLIAQKRGDFDTALLNYQRALAIVETLVPDSLMLAKSFIDLGFLANDRGALDDSVAFFNHALAITKKFAPKSLTMATIFFGLGQVANDRGDVQTSVEYFQKTLLMRERMGCVNSEVAETRNCLAKSYWRLGQEQQTQAHIEASIESHEAQLGKLGGSYNVNSRFQGQFGNYYKDYIDFLVSESKPKLAFDILERARARVLYRMISERDLVLSGPEIPIKLEQDRKRIAYQYETAQHEFSMLEIPEKEGRDEDKERRKELNDWLLELRLNHDDIIEQIRKASPRLANLRAPKPLILAQVKNPLDPGTTMLSYCVMEDKTFLFVVRNQAELVVHTIEKGEADLHAQIKALHDVIKEPKNKKSAEMLKIISRDLYTRLIAPARNEIEACSRLLIIQDGSLQKLPFNLLQDEEGKYLIVWKPITTAVSATIYAELKERKTRDTLQIAAFGDSLYSNQAKSKTRARDESIDVGFSSEADDADPQLRGFLRHNPNELERLPYTAEEIQSIAQEFPNQTRIYLGEEANEKNVKALGKGPSIIHLACHGWVNDVESYAI